MIRYKIYANNAEAEIWLDSDDPNVTAPLQYKGDAELIDTIKWWLEYAHGAFGHLIGSHTTPIDLDAALIKGPKAIRVPDMTKILRDYRFEIIEGAHLVESYDPKIPKGAFT